MKLGLGGLLVLGVFSLIFKTDPISPLMPVGSGWTAPAVSDRERDLKEQEAVGCAGVLRRTAHTVQGAWRAFEGS